MTNGWKLVISRIIDNSSRASPRVGRHDDKTIYDLRLGVRRREITSGVEIDMAQLLLQPKLLGVPVDTPLVKIAAILWAQEFTHRRPDSQVVAYLMCTSPSTMHTTTVNTVKSVDGAVSCHVPGELFRSTNN